MKPKLLYIIALLITAACVIRFVTDNQRLTAQNSALTQQITALQQNIVTLQSTVDKQQQTIAEQREAQKTDRGGERPRYSLTDAECDLIECVVMAEAQGEPYEGQVLVAQCILNACEIDGIRPAETIKKYVYAKARPEPSQSVVNAVSAVFDRGVTVTDEKIVYFYAPGRVRSEFHESQRFVCEVGGHRFFADK